MVNFFVNRYIKLYLLTLVFCIAFPYGMFFISNVISPSWSFQVDSTITSIDISENDEYIVVGTYGGYVYLFHKNNANPIQEYNIEDQVFKVDICADGRYIVVGTMGRLLLFNRSSPNMMREYFLGPNIAAGTFCFSDNGEYIVVGSSYYLYSPDSIDKLFLFQRNNSLPLWEIPFSVEQIDIASNGRSFIIGGSRGLSLFSIENINPLWNFSSSKSGSTSISDDGHYIAFSDHFTNNLYLFTKGSSTPIWQCHFDSNPYPIRISADGNYVLSVSNTNVSLFKNKDFLAFTHNKNYGPFWNYEISGSSPSADISFNGEFLVVATELPSWELFRSKIYVFNKYQLSPVWSQSFENVKLDSKIASKENYIVVAINEESHSRVYKIDFMNSFPNMDYLYVLINILFFSGVPSTIIVWSSFILDIFIQKRRSVKKVLLEEEELTQEFINNLDGLYKKWEKKGHKKHEYDN
jgi:hypothetical protein